ncbi:MAG: 23S rRNA (adenine(2503)-C(2))-methyltransferase RlmN, partial [Akkermansia sp.]|nr:23S rRNA (adenine(2503)-C(2))-methyltransferase RlmN [Akkermansia sp.]
MTAKTCLIGCTPTQLIELMASLGQKPYRAKQLQEWVWKHRVTDFEAMTNLPPALREQLAAQCTLRPLEVVEVNES